MSINQAAAAHDTRLHAVTKRYIYKRPGHRQLTSRQQNAFVVVAKEKK